MLVAVLPRRLPLFFLSAVLFSSMSAKKFASYLFKIEFIKENSRALAFLPVRAVTKAAVIFKDFSLGVTIV